MRGTSAVGRLAAIAAVLLAAVAVVVLLLNRGGDPYLVKMRFQNASQLVNGNLVQVSGSPIGTVESITLTEDGQAEVTAKIEDRVPAAAPGAPRPPCAPRPLSGVANRYIDLQMPPATAPAIAVGRSDRAGRHHHRRRPRPAVQRLRPPRAPVAAGRAQGLRPALLGPREAGQPRPGLPQPLDRRHQPADPRAGLRRARACAPRSTAPPTWSPTSAPAARTSPP